MHATEISVREILLRLLRTVRPVYIAIHTHQPESISEFSFIKN
jgi:hypothetical protein